ncbi:hypothetical protein K8Z61_15455 [Nocardioides sp. TRM66260-LWL]|uniref:ATP-binding protein n=1 Tax=Nocardioides sp. TRM66260-LWL TaxID=2874478 RepID=UPI001CC6B7A0|nr:histidine kinase dimerization/phospho-acceptor domain-containing protein [Nocardioides sp. TRM66260-LWL]MBZ5735890.1 hypothetical protein [Nocardioides sp. TRM66260-LWL]
MTPVAPAGVPWWRSLRLPIALAVALSAVCSALVIGYVSDRSAVSEGLTRLRAEAEARLSAAEASYEFTGAVARDATLVAADAREPSAPVPLPPPLVEAARAAPEHRMVTYFSDGRMWAARRLDGGEVLAAEVSADSLARERDHLHRTFLLVGLQLLLVAFLVGWLVAGPITGRLRRAARWVEVGALQQAPEPLRTRRRDEVDELVAGIDALSSTLRDRVRTEQAFTADVAHELRTPLTALVSASSLLPADDAASVLVRQQVERLRLLVDDLLELARADQAAPAVEALTPLDVPDLLARIVAQLPDLAPDELVVTDPVPVLGEQRRLERVLVNLLANARRHGSAPVRVRIDGERVVVRDAGEGYPPQVLLAGPQRLHAVGRTAGAGLGLALADAYARQIGATLTLANDDGAVATVRLTVV